MVLRPTPLPGKIRSTEDRLNLAWGFYFRFVILQLCPPIIDVILEVPVANDFLNLFFEGDALLNGVIDIFMELVVLVVSFGVVST